MAQSKRPSNRASMREGPLAALFRKTEEDEAAEGQQSLPESEARREEGQTRPPAAGETTQSKAAGTTRSQAANSRKTEQLSARESERPLAQGRPDRAGAESGQEQRSAARAKEQAIEGNRAGTRGEAHAIEEEEPPSIPSPRERLRNVFSAEIPANVMERPGAATAAARELPPADVYAREEPRPTGADGQPVIHPVIRVVGVGGAGVNAVNRMVEAEVEGVEFLAINTDLQSLQQSTADITLHIGAELTRGLGSGSDTNLGRQAAMEDYDRAKALLKGSDMIFITAGAGGGTGTGAAPIVARIAREVGALAVAIVTKPFGFEGSRRAEQAEQGVQALADEVDTLIVVPNNRLLSVLDKQTSMVDAFRVADDVLRQGVQGISDLVTLPGLINLDFADVRTIMSGAGNALLGIGMGAGGEHRATEAAMQAVASPLLETSMEGARSILLSITGGRDLSLWEVNEAAKAVSEAAHPDANIIFGAMVDEKLEDQVWVTVVATGYDTERRGSRSSGRGRLEEPAGEPRVQRSGRASSSRRERRGGLAVDELEVPEFMPRG
jgi:cell division protein FtsZ